MRLIISLTGLVMAYLIYGFYISQVNYSIIPPELKREHPEGYYDYRGVSNIRTELSNGSSSPVDVIAEAKLTGLDFVILTDLNQFDHSESINGYNGNLLVMNEGEYTYLDSRLLHYSLEKENPPESSGEVSVYFTDLLSQKSSDHKDTLLVLAHPFNNGPTWTGPYPQGLDGIEIVNPKAISENAWRRSKLNVIWSFIVYPFSPRYAFLRLFREPSDEIALWDKLSSERHTIGFGGADATARAIPWAGALVKFPSYHTSFEITSNHVLLNSELTGNYAKDRQKIFTALKRGNFYVSLDILGDPRGFIAKIVDKDKTYLMGETLPFKKNLHLQADLATPPKDFFEFIVYKNGEKDFISNNKAIDYEIKSPGVYRVVVRVSPTLPLPDGKKWISWIYTNTFTIQ
jgi:hypothetical protein